MAWAPWLSARAAEVYATARPRFVLDPTRYPAARTRRVERLVLTFCGAGLDTLTDAEPDELLVLLAYNEGGSSANPVARCAAALAKSEQPSRRAVRHAEARR
jgi:hypothetical protein